MSVDTRHPDYTSAREKEWRLMRDAFDGESAIKARSTEYLPAPPGWAEYEHREAMYDAYINRARFPEITSGTIRGISGVLHSQEWHKQIPPAMEFIWERATSDGQPLEVFERRITTELLTTGRYAVLADAPDVGGNPYMAGFAAESLTNWDVARNFYVLQEQVNRRDGFDWENIKLSRVLELDEAGLYRQSIYEDGQLVETFEPRAQGGARLDYIPLTVGGAMDMDLKPDVPPLIGVARAALAYCQEYADYRMALFMAYQATLFVYNASEPPTTVGSGMVVALSSAEIGKDVRAEYVTPPASAIEAHERAMDREQASAVRSGAAMFDNAGTPGQESGEARRLRFSAETATIRSIANASAAILEGALRDIGRMIGLGDGEIAEIVVAPPDNLLEGRMAGADITALVNAWERGAFGFETLYENLQRGRIASIERTAEEEQALIDALPAPRLPQGDVL